jgi:hypothetical protein
MLPPDHLDTPSWPALMAVAEAGLGCGSPYVVSANMPWQQQVHFLRSMKLITHAAGTDAIPRRKPPPGIASLQLALAPSSSSHRDQVLRGALQLD